MSQPGVGLLNEEELKCHINGFFNLKLDRDALIKPSKEIIFDIYARFLDYFQLSWRKPNPSLDFDDSGPNLKFRMVGIIRPLLAKFEPPYEFNMSDVITPTRKRTTTFLNFIIFIKADIDDAWHKWQVFKDELIERQEEGSEIKRSISELKLKIEEIALAKSSLKPMEDWQKIEKRRHFEAIQAETEVLKTNAKLVKENNEIESELLRKEKEELELLTRDCEGPENTLKRQLRLASDEASLQDQLAHLERSKDRTTAEHRLKLEQLKLDSNKIIGQMHEVKMQYESKILEMKSDIKEIKIKRAEIQANKESAEKLNQASIDQSNRRLESLKKRIQESRSASQLIIPMVEKAQKQIDTLMGQPREIELPADRTYIKEADRTYIKESTSFHRRIN